MPKKVYARQERGHLLLELGILRSSPFIPTIIAYCMYPTEAPRLSLALCVCLVYLALRVSDIVEQKVSLDLDLVLLFRQHSIYV
jgi:hypothetical protein